MSQIALKSFLAFKSSNVGDVGFEFFPTPADVNVSENGLIVTLGNVPFPEDVPHPRNALTVLYGFRDSSDEMQKQYARARQHGMSLVAILSDYEVGASTVRVTSFEDLKETKFINLKRCASLLQYAIVDGVNERMALEGIGSKLFDSWLDLGRRPDLLCDFMRADDRFSHVTAVGYHLPSDGSAPRMVVSIFKPQDCGFIVRGQCPFEIRLPTFT